MHLILITEDFTNLSDNGIICGGDFMEDPIYSLEGSLILSGHTIIRLVIELHTATLEPLDELYRINILLKLNFTFTPE